MAHNFDKVWVGFEDESITEKHKSVVNFTTNKIGGKPDWPLNRTLENTTCSLCQLPRPLVLQIYAPLDNSPYHRTLYLFACINPKCWNQEESWTCIRVQAVEQATQPIDTSFNPISVNDWCEDADDWGDDNNANITEENGNIVNNIERISDEDDESCSLEESIRAGLGSLAVDDNNANTGMAAEAQGGAVGRLHSPRATAEIEGNEGEVISIDTPTLPRHNLAALLQEVTPLPQELCQKTQSDLIHHSKFEFASCFLSVCEESGSNATLDRHVKELLTEYQQKNDEITCEDVGSGGEEGYEKSAPAHGDKMFHYFLTKIQKNPGQLIRYSRDNAAALLLFPLTDTSRRCDYCGAELIFEFQVLSTIIPKLRLITDGNDHGARLEFGTVLIFTCSRSCWASESTFCKEVVVLQKEKF